VAWIASTSPLSELLGVNPKHLQARAFLQGLRELGYVDGKNLVIEWRSAEGKHEDLPEIIRQLVANNVDVIVSPANVVTKAAKSVTQALPIVMAGNAIPVAYGFVESLARPGGNITGLSAEVGVEIAGKNWSCLKSSFQGAHA
jgi:putative ABC transport system substrate-binding protein